MDVFINATECGHKCTRTYCKTCYDLEADGRLAAEQAYFKCCSRNAWGDGNHDPNCRWAQALILLSQAGRAMNADAHETLHTEITGFLESLKIP